jgi:hypothetical protein
MIQQRSERGSLAALGFIGMIPLLMAIGAFAIDLMHVNDTKGALQRSCDAAALAGAARLYSYDTDHGAAAQNAAEAILRTNWCDGRLIDNHDPNITYTVTFPKIPVGGIGGQVQVDAQMRTHGLFSALFNSFTQTVTASSLAGFNGNNNVAFAGQVFPIALGLNLPDQSGVSLANRHIGDTFTIQFAPDGSDNAGWTTLKGGGGASTIKGLIDGYKDASTSGAQAVQVNDDINLKNGEIASALSSVGAFAGKTVIVPVVDTNKFNHSAKIEGFVGVTIVSVGSGSPKQIVAKLAVGEMNGAYDPSIPMNGSGANSGTFFADKTVGSPKLLN